MGYSQLRSPKCFKQEKSGRLNTEQAAYFSVVVCCIPLYEACFLFLIMKKDPAFLFYPGSWLKGTQLMSRPHKGALMDLLMAQFDNIRLSLDDIKTILGSDYETMWENKLKNKFVIDAKGLYYNEKLDRVIKERNNYKKGRLDNLKGKKTPHKDTPYGKPCGDSYGKPICKDKDKDINNNKYKEMFEQFRIKYPGTKSGLSVAFEYFKKKVKNWKEVLPLLLPALEKEINYKQQLKNNKQFCPEWKILQTWINKKCWTEEYPEIERDDTYEKLN